MPNIWKSHGDHRKTWFVTLHGLPGRMLLIGLGRHHRGCRINEVAECRPVGGGEQPFNSGDTDQAVLLEDRYRGRTVKAPAPQTVKRRGHEIIRGRRGDTSGGMPQGGVGAADKVGSYVADHEIGQYRAERSSIDEPIGQGHTQSPATRA